MTGWTRALLLAAVLGCGANGETPASAQEPSPDVSEATTTRNSGEHKRGAALDPRPFQRVLRAHLRSGRVDYSALGSDVKAKRALSSYLAAAATMSDNAPLSSWLNVYNALVIQQVLERYPLQSVMKVPGFFKKRMRVIAGRRRSLDEIEHAVIRPRFEDARVHFALNCGAVSCPPLSSRAFVEATLDRDLDALVRRALADPRHLRVAGDKLEASALFFWFEEDFVREAGSVVAWIERYAPPAVVALGHDVELVELPYNWDLAEAK